MADKTLADFTTSLNAVIEKLNRSLRGQARQYRDDERREFLKDIAPSVTPDEESKLRAKFQDLHFTHDERLRRDLFEAEEEIFKVVKSLKRKVENRVSSFDRGFEEIVERGSRWAYAGETAYGNGIGQPLGGYGSGNAADGYVFLQYDGANGGPAAVGGEIEDGETPVRGNSELEASVAGDIDSLVRSTSEMSLDFSPMPSDEDHVRDGPKRVSGKSSGFTPAPKAPERSSGTSMASRCAPEGPERSSGVPSSFAK